MLYTVRSERMLKEQLEYNLLFRVVRRPEHGRAGVDVTVFTKNRERLLKADIAKKFFEQVLKQAQALDLMSDEHFTVDGTLLEACAGLKSFKRVDGEPKSRRRMILVIPRWIFTGEKRSNWDASIDDGPGCHTRRARGRRLS